MPTDRVDTRAPRGAPPLALVEGLLLGIVDAEGETLGIARLASVEAEAGTLVIETPIAAARIARIVPGRVVWPAHS